MGEVGLIEKACATAARRCLSSSGLAKTSLPIATTFLDGQNRKVVACLKPKAAAEHGYDGDGFPGDDGKHPALTEVRN
ncbi:hypothetical protein [Actinomadura hibisca]|uniref:hypothetical protein n=1 Tax=Actinomadura hibisca TaxID=68565 RepID=UPI0012FB2872|nr:hypothetical protein [Actinomadura hibisca]